MRCRSATQRRTNGLLPKKRNKILCSPTAANNKAPQLNATIGLLWIYESDFLSKIVFVGWLVLLEPLQAICNRMVSVCFVVIYDFLTFSMCSPG